MKRILAVFAHPDDETFGPGGTLLTWAKKGYEIHLLCVTHGENGMNNTKHHTAHVRERELKKAAKILGIARVEFLDFIDGTIGNHDIPRLREKITAKIRTFQPHRILTFDLTGVSGHLDHVAVANAVRVHLIKPALPTSSITGRCHGKIQNWSKIILFTFPREGSWLKLTRL